MDGHFVPNISYGMPVIKAIKKHAAKPLDVHLRIEKPEKDILKNLANVGADIITVHYGVNKYILTEHYLKLMMLVVKLV